MENHPDRFPSERKPLQELRIIALNEAYASLMSRSREPWAADPLGADSGNRHPAAPGPGAVRQPPRGAVGLHRDPAYANYKQGFL
jgi:hypothetical protein